MPAIILRTEIRNSSPIPGLGRGFARIRKQALRDVATFWHDELLPSHFGPSNRSRYQHEPREAFYLQIIKKQQGRGQGKYVDDVFSGKSMRFMMAFFQVTGTQNAMTVTMRPPGYFANPFEGTYTDPKTGKQKRISGQPDKPREVTTVDARDNDALAKFHAERLETLIAEDAARRATTKTL
jgi:hypothetical protein